MASRQNATATANSTVGFLHQGKAKSSHPVGHFRDKTKYNNRNGRYANRNIPIEHSEQEPREQQTPRDTYISQEELAEHLTSKLRENKFVEIKTKEIKNDRGTLYEIDVINPGLYRIGNGTFFSMKLHTVSHKSRIIFITIIFNDDEGRNADMRINADAIIQIFREIAPDTIETISITDVKDSKGNEHLAVRASTFKQASLNYTYKCAMEFVHVVDEKYGSSDSAPANDGSSDSALVEDGAATATTEDMSADQIDIESALLEKKLKALQELKLAKSSQPSQEAVATSADAPETDKGQTQTHTRTRSSKFTIKVGEKTMFVKH